MKLFDIHAHLQSKKFSADLMDVLNRAQAAGVEKILNAATEPSDWSNVLDLSRKSPICLSALGIHPWYIPIGAENFLDSLTDNDFHSAAAIGEIGLDKTTELIPIDRQIIVFEKQLSIAKELRIPSIIHCRGAFGELIASAKKVGLGSGAAIHAFNGSEELAKDLIRHGFLLSIGGVITYHDSRKREKMLRTIYPDFFLLETDSPDIPPAEKKGERNEPSYIRYVLASCSAILGVQEEQIAEQAEKNIAKLFSL